MFTTGSKLFLGATGLALASLLVFGATHGGEPGWLGTVVLIGALLALAALTAVNFFTRDGNTSSMAPDITHTAAAAQAPVRRSVAPILAAIGAGVTAIGAETRPWFFKLGIIVLLAAAAEWLVTAWSDRASSDASFNQAVSSRLLQPLQFPIVAAVGLGVIVFSFSRIMLWVDKSGGPVVFGILGALVLLGGYLVASKPHLQRGAITGVAAIAALGLVSTGAVMALDGQREIHKHPTTADEPAVCDEAGKNPEVDKRAPGDVMSISSPSAIVVVQDGKLAVYSQGLRGARPDVTLIAGQQNNIIFRNQDSEPRRFTLNLGTFTDSSSGTAVTTSPKECTTLIEPGGEVLKTIRYTRPSSTSQTPYTITVPGIADQAITVLVP